MRKPDIITFHNKIEEDVDEFQSGSRWALTVFFFTYEWGEAVLDLVKIQLISSKVPQTRKLQTCKVSSLEAEMQESQETNTLFLQTSVYITHLTCETRYVPNVLLRKKNKKDYVETVFC